MSRISIPIDMLTSRLNLSDRFSSLRAGGLSGRFSNLRPFSEFFDVKRVSKPNDFGEMQSRLNYNLGHFSSNYAVVFVLLAVYGLVTNPWLLFDIAFVVAGMFFISKLDGRDLEIGQNRFSTSQLYTILYGVAVIVGFLFANVFWTMLWLAGASGCLIFGHAAFMDKPIDQWGRPVEKGRGAGASWSAGEKGGHRSGRRKQQRVIEVLDSDEEDDGYGADNGVGSVTTVNREGSGRVVSDSLRFTGVDLGERTGTLHPRSVYKRQPGEEEYDDFSDEQPHNSRRRDDTSDDNSDQPSEDNETDDIWTRDREDALVDSALARIRKAQARGRKEVKLNKNELQALERRRKRIKKEKRRNQRIAVPLSQLDPSTLTLPPRRQDKLPRVLSPNSNKDVQSYGHSPTGGVYARSSSPRPLSHLEPSPRPGSRSSVHADREHHQRRRDSSPFSFSYVQPGPPPARRHVSETVLRVPGEDVWARNPYASGPTNLLAPSVQQRAASYGGPVDVFQYMMEE